MTMKKADMPDRVMRWSMYLQQFDYAIEHRGGTRMKHVDALSRVYSLLLIEDSLKCRLKEAQGRDDWIRAVKKVLEKDVYDDYYENNELLYKDPNKELLVVPTDMEGEIIKIAHRQGHIGAKKTQELLQNRYFIPNLGEKVNRVVKSCVECLVTDAKAGKKEGLLTPIDKSSEPLGTYHIDHVGPLSETRKQYNYILVVVDSFSKFIWLYPTKSTGAEEVIERLRKQAATFGNPKRIVTDRGTAFTSHQFKKYCTDEGIQHLLIATGVPRGNGQVERMHRIIVPMVSKLCQSNPTQWYRHVEEVQRVINNTPPRSTKLTPFKILTGLEMRTAENPDLRELLENAELYELDEQREQVRSEAKKNIGKIQEENRKYFNRNRQKAKQYKAGDLVAIKRTQFGVNMKLRPRFLGPYKVTDILNHDRYKLEKEGEHEGPIKTISVAEFMKPWGPIIQDE